MELKPCPVCGGEVKIVDMIDDYYQVRCTKCPLDFGRYWFYKNQKRMLREAWNRRVGGGEKE